MNRMKLSIATFALALSAGLLCVSCGDQANTASTTAATNDSLPSATVSADGVNYNGKIVYIQLDSLMRGYGRAMDLQESFEAKSLKAQNELTSKGRSLEREIRDYSEKAGKGLITRSQAAEIEAGLQKKEQDVLAYRDRVMQELGEEEAVMMNQISNAILEYVKKYNAEKGYSMIISTTGANTVLIADPSLNITEDILAGLNAEYRAEVK